MSRQRDSIMAFRNHLLAAAFVLGANLLSARGEAFLQPGDHVAIIGNTYADQLRVHGYLETLIRLHTGGDKPIPDRNLGWAGDTLTHRDRPTGFPTEEATLNDFGADVIIGCFGMGESFDGETGLADFRQDLLDFLASHDRKSYNNGESTVRLALVSPIAYEDLGTRTPNHERRNAELAAYSGVIATVAAERNLPFIDLNRPSAELMSEQDAPDLTSNGITLNAYGYWALSTNAADELVGGVSGWKLAINPTAGSMSRMEGLEARPGKTHDNGFDFTVTELSTPFLAPPGDGSPNASLKEHQDVLTIGGLDAGSHTLAINGDKIVTATADQWATGVVLTNTPAHRALEAYRQAVNDKNTQFTYAWKAYNQVHIVGERRSSPAGQALPAELVEFQTLTRKREAALAKGIELKTRTWSVMRE